MQLSSDDMLSLFEDRLKAIVSNEVVFNTGGTGGRRKLNPNKTKKVYQAWFDMECRRGQLKLHRIRRQ